MITVEDYNTVALNHVNDFYTCDTGLIGSDEFDSVLYDFIIVSHTVSGSNHTFKFEVNSDLWCGGYYFKKHNDDYISSNGTYNSADNSISFTTTEDNVKLVLYLCSFPASFNFERLENQLNDTGNLIVTHDQIGETTTTIIKDLTDDTTSEETITLTNGTITVTSSPHLYLLCEIKKSDLIFDLSETTCTVGEKNIIPLGIDDDFLPEGALVDNDDLDLEIIYNNQKINVAYDEDIGDYCFELDLTNKTDNKNEKFKLICNEIDVVNHGVFDCTVACSYAVATSFSELQSMINNGSEIIQLNNTLTFTSDLTVDNDVYIVGAGNLIQMDNHSIIVENNINVKCDNVDFNSGNPAFIQRESTKIVLNGCNFHLCAVSDNYKGSVLSTEYNNLNTNAEAEIINCYFNNCHHSIYYDGDLLLKDCRAKYTEWNNSIDTDYSELLTLTDGTAEITGGIYDIDFDTDYLCSNEIDIKFTQTLIGLGINTMLNGASANLLKADESLPFTTNASHLYAKYYYSNLEECCISSPVLDREDKAVCHTILGEDWIYKNNVIVTKASSETENNIRKITWEEI